MSNTTTSGCFAGVPDALYRQKVENAYLIAKPRVIEACRQRHGLDPFEGGACLFWAVYGSQALAHVGIETIMQAGTMFWRIVPEQMQHTAPLTQMFNFGYQFGYERCSAERVMEGCMPEQHCWLADARANIVIDFSTSGIKAWFDKNCPGQEWQSPKPPEYLAVRSGSRPDDHGASYTSHRLATLIAMKFGRAFADDVGMERPPCLRSDASYDKIIEQSTQAYVMLTTRKGKIALHPEHVRSLRDQCNAAGTAFHFKQWGNWVIEEGRSDFAYKSVKEAGRTLDGAVWDQFPEVERMA